MGSDTGSDIMIARCVRSSMASWPNPEMDPHIVSYAKAARCGCVL
jgi:hypothetical protein